MGATESIAGLGSRADHVAPAPGVDALKLRLTADEATLLAKVGKVIQIQELLARSGLAESAAISLLLSLRAKGAIVPARVNAPTAPSAVDASALEQVDLEPDRKAEILAREKGVESQNHYEVLELSPGATPEEIKAAYYELSRRFHPDRFYNKNLGSFRARIDRVFRRIHEANQVLSDANKRAAYLKANPHLVPRKAEAPPPAPRTAEDEARDAERRARLSRHPYLARQLKAQGLVARGKAAMEKGEYAEAYSNLHRATQMGPHPGAAPELLDETRRKHEVSRARAELQTGNQARAAGKLEEALRAFRMALSLDPKLSTAAGKAAEILLERGDLDEAFRLAEQAVKLEPRRAETHVTLGRVQLARDTRESKSAARQHFETALQLDPENEEAKKGLKKTRGLF